MAFAPPASFPAVTLRDLAGQPWPVPLAWSSGPALFVLGHGDCPTSRFTLPFVDRIHRRRGPGTAVAAILQDEPEAARELKAQLDLGLPVLLEPPPYDLAAALGLATVPTVFVVDRDGRIELVVEAFQRDGLERAARRLGVAGSLFAEGDNAPELRPG